MKWPIKINFGDKKEEAPWKALVAFLGSQPVWSEKDPYVLANAGFKQNMTIYQCVMMLARSCAGIEWLLQQLPVRSDGDIQEIDQHDLLNLLHRPNPRHGQSAFIEKVVANYWIHGNAYILKVGPDLGPPKELYTLMPHLVRVIPGNNVNPVGGYEYRINPTSPKVYKPEDVLHLRAFHPLNEFYGLSPLEVAGMGIDVLNMAIAWNYKLLKNDMRPPGGIKVEGNLNEGQRQALREKFKETYQGYQNVAEPIVVEGGGEWQPFSYNPKDVDWLGGLKVFMRMVSGVLNIKSELLGDAENKTYSNVKEARRALYEECVLPFMDYLRDEFNYWLAPKFGDRLRLEYNKDDIEAMKEDRTAVYTRMQQSHWLTVNEKRDATGYDDIGPAGDVVLVPIGMVPLEMTSIEKERDWLNEGKSDKTPSFWQKKENKRRLWLHFVKRVEMKEKTLIGPAEAYLKAQAREIAEKIRKYKTIEDVDVNRVFSVDKDSQKYLEDFRSIYMENLLTAGEAGLQASEGKLMDLDAELKAETGFQLSQELIAEMEQLIIKSGAKIARTTLGLIEALVNQGKRMAWTVEELTQNVWSKLKTFSIWRARTVARTEMCKVENWGQVEGYRQSRFVKKKGWLCSMVPDSRDSHIQADHEYSEAPIHIDDPFIVGGEAMQQPGDGNASADNIVNCLCTTYPEVVELIEPGVGEHV